MPPALALALGVFAVAGAILCVIDVRAHRLPDAVVLPAAVAVLLLAALAAVDAGRGDRALAVAGSTIAAGATCLVLHLARPASFGGGDVKLGALVGAALGWWGLETVASALLVAFTLGAVAGVGVLAAGARRTEVAFGPALVLGAWWVLLRSPP